MNVMTKAWEIARKGQKKFGGKVREYFAQALKMAWAIVKNVMEPVTLDQKTKNAIKKEIIRQNSYNHITKQLDPLPAWIVEYLDDLTDQGAAMIEKAISNGKINSVDEKIIYAAAFKAVSACY